MTGRPATPIRVGVAGLGTVGAGVLRLLAENRDTVARRAGRPIVVAAVSARDRSRDRGITLGDAAWCDDPAALADDPSLHAVVELIGGADGPARALVERALARGRDVVTANKALVAVRGADLAALAAGSGAAIAFEAAVAGGIPAIKSVREGLAANRFRRVAGILNGTCNHILTTMRESGRPFGDVLAEAQALGYAEADPAADVDGIDTAHKLAILAAIAFDQPIPFDAVHVEGIRRLGPLDIAFAGELGFRLKLLGIARRTADGIEARVHPALVPTASPLGGVEGVYNAVVADGDFSGRVTLEGRGAGAGPTASAVVADLIDLARGRRPPPLPGPTDDAVPVLPIVAHHGAYYLRLLVLDRPGVIAEVAAALRDARVSLKSMLQHGQAPGEPVPIVLVTHEVGEFAMGDAVGRIAALDVVLEPPLLIRIES